MSIIKHWDKVKGLLAGINAAAFCWMCLTPLTLDVYASERGAGEAAAEMRTVTEWYEAVGTVRPRTETSIEAQVTAQVVDVKVRPGSKVSKGMLLVTLDNRMPQSRLDQAKEGLSGANAAKRQAAQGVNVADAAFKNAESHYQRIKTYFASKAATSQSLEQAESEFLQARASLEKAREALSGSEAGIRQAQEMIKEAEIGLNYTRVLAPEDGEVLKRAVEPGDLALPGKPLLILQTANTLLLEASVREGLIQLIKIGQTFPAAIGSLDNHWQAVIEEIVPYADPKTRTFLVKASLPKAEGIFPGMFGKLLIPVMTHQVVMIPLDAVRRVGQLELVRVKEANAWKTRYIKTGKQYQGMVEVLSGLSGNETVGLKEN